MTPSPQGPMARKLRGGALRGRWAGKGFVLRGQSCGLLTFLPGGHSLVETLALTLQMPEQRMKLHTARHLRLPRKITWLSESPSHFLTWEAESVSRKHKAEAVRSVL